MLRIFPLVLMVILAADLMPGGCTGATPPSPPSGDKIFYVKANNAAPGNGKA